MPQNMTLTLVNPALKTNEIRTGLKGGNALDIRLTNQSGFDLSFVGGEGGSDLLVTIPTTIIDPEAAGRITVAAPWSVDCTPPKGRTEAGDGDAPIVLRLSPPPAPGLPFKNKQNVTIALAHVEPTAKGSATILASYAFAELGSTATASAQLTVLGAPDPSKKTLLGPDNALLYGLRVNDGPAENPVFRSKPPVVPGSAVENRLHLNFVFQNQEKVGQDNPSLGRLLDGWDPLNPPTFRIWFPYSDAQSSLPAPLTLTDDYKEGDPEYNALTSARNIRLSLSGTDPGITSNDWWTAVRDPRSQSPAWLVQPTPANTYLFTGSKADSPGPFLDLYFSHIYTGLGIDPSQPETLIYLETYDFPGFNDRLSPRPLFKEAAINIARFSGKIDIVGGTTTLKLDWTTTGDVDYCLVSGFSDRQGSQSDGGFSRTMDQSTPLRSQYTLTAVGNGGVATMRKTIWVQWTEGPSSILALDFPSAIDISPDGGTLYVAGNNVVNLLASRTLVGDRLLEVPNGRARNVVATPDGTRLFVAALPLTGSDSFVAGYTTGLQPLGPAPVTPGINAASNVYPMAVSPDSTQLALSIATPPGANPPRIWSYDAATMTPEPDGASPAEIDTLRSMGLTFHGDLLFYPDKGGLGVLDRKSLKPVTGSPVSLGSGSVTPYTPGPVAVSPDGKSLATLARGTIAGRRAFVLCLVDLQNMRLRQRVQVDVGYGTAPPVPTTWIGYSSDGLYLFAFGTDYTTDPPNLSRSLFRVYDPATLQEVGWTVSPSTIYADAVAAPDGSRIYLTTQVDATSFAGHVMVLIPVFGPPAT